MPLSPQDQQELQELRRMDELEAKYGQAQAGPQPSVSLTEHKATPDDSSFKELAARGARRVAESYTLGLAGPPISAGEAAVRKLGGDARDFGDLYQDSRASQDSYMKQHPVIAAQADLAGAFAPGNLLGRVVGGTGKGLESLLKPSEGFGGYVKDVARGALQGGISGEVAHDVQGAAEAAQGKPFEHSMVPAAAGTFVGGAVPAVTQPIKYGVDKLGQFFSGMEDNAAQAWKANPDEVRKIHESRFGNEKDASYVPNRVRAAVGDSQGAIQKDIDALKNQKRTMLSGPESTIQIPASDLEGVGHPDLDSQYERTKALQGPPRQEHIQVPVYEKKAVEGGDYMRITPNEQPKPSLQDVIVGPRTPEKYPISGYSADELKGLTNKAQGDFKAKGPGGDVVSPDPELGRRAVGIDEALNAKHPDVYGPFRENEAPKFGYRQLNEQISDRSKLMGQLNKITDAGKLAHSNSSKIEEIAQTMDEMAAGNLPEHQQQALGTIRNQMSAADSFRKGTKTHWHGYVPIPLKAAGRTMMLGADKLDDEKLKEFLLKGTLGLTY